MYKEEKRAMGPKYWVTSEDLRIRIMRKHFQLSGTKPFLQISFRIDNSKLIPSEERCLRKREEMLSTPVAGDLRDKMAADNSKREKGEDRILSSKVACEKGKLI